MTRKPEARVDLYLVTPEQKPEIVWPSIQKDALSGEINIIVTPVSIWKFELLIPM